MVCRSVRPAILILTPVDAGKNRVWVGTPLPYVFQSLVYC
ncbi:hypothetical protein [Leishmaniavirus sani]|uniref:Uncharacterized protein n=1 Tax=Leishmania aethiopica RNA virus TaxID=1497019 RepID=A0A024B2N4_9VIRU|nr:hypothetical protein [Leishmania aethiopica RNA virus]AHZ10899.1 hypothetical protein [Leishmania aethiopica RNA virus]